MQAMATAWPAQLALPVASSPWRELHECFLSSDPQETGRHISGLTHGRCRFSAKRNEHYFFQSVNESLGGTGLQRLRWDTPAECQTQTSRADDDHFTLHLALRGTFEASQGKARASVAPGQMLLVSDPGWIKRGWRGECEVFNLAINRPWLERVLASELAVDLMQPLKFENLALASPQATATFSRFIDNVWLDLTQADSCFRNSYLGRHAERTVGLMLLQCFPNNYRHRFQEPAPVRGTPFYVRRVQEFIHSHSAAGICLDDLIEVSGVSTRSLHYGFKASLGVSPMRYLKQVRLTNARDALAGSVRTGETITSIALRTGYSNLSRFSHDYKEYFGEGPRQSRRGG